METGMTVGAPPVQPPPPEAAGGAPVDLTKTGAVPARVQAEFTARGPIDPVRDAELRTLEAEIEARIQGRVPQAAPAPAPAVAQQPADGILPPVPAPTPLTAQAPQAPAQPVPAQPMQIPPNFQPAADPNQPFQPNVHVALNQIDELLRAERARLAPPPAPQQSYGYPQQPQQPQGYQGYPQAQPPQQAPQQFGLEQRLENDLRVAPVQTLLNLQRAAVQTAQDASEGRVRELEMKLELMQIAQADPYVFTAPGIQALVKVRAERPWLDGSPTPWFSAYELLGRRTGPNAGAPSMAGGYPVPAAPAPAYRPVAPVVPGGYAPVVPANSAAAPSITNEAELRSYVMQKYPNNPGAQAQYLEDVIRRAAAVAGAR